ncbi:protein of unknown function [Mesotoga infera]|uniref:Uncharacterized protein n=1 Tax=Mesotoga infera TaxID=1236046 RepID=A0A7Z7LG00_9BACT|nr:protein of unknown function [Mesotoga infera]
MKTGDLEFEATVEGIKGLIVRLDRG